MEFASTHILNYDESDEEEIDDSYMEGAFALYQGLSVNNALYGGLQPVAIPGSSASADYDNPGFRGDHKGRVQPNSVANQVYDNAIFGASSNGEPRSPQRTYDNAVFGASSGGQRPGQETQIYDNAGLPEVPDTTYTPLLQIQKPGVDTIYDNPNMPQKQKVTKKGTAWKTGRGQRAVYTEVPRVYDAVGEGSSGPLPPPLPPSRRTSQPNEDDYSYVALKKSLGTKKVRRADTNIVAVKFDTLSKPSQVVEGKPVPCERCSSMLSHLSNVVEDERGMIWRCEFCGLENLISTMAVDLPSQGDMTYVLSPGSESGDDTVIIFCVDISGSMSVTTEIPTGGGGTLRQNNESAALNMYHKELQTAHPDQASQQIPNLGVSYVSRLQAMQSAIDKQLNNLEANYPNKRVGIVAFNDTVTIIGDGTSPPIPLEGAGLTDFQSLVELGTAMPESLPIAEVKRCLADKVFSLTEGGQTALGPALLISVAMASQRSGSKVLICTDGLANVGMGLMQEVDDDIYQQSMGFFEDVGCHARDAGVCVSVLSIEGEDCRVIELGNVADKTGGRVTIVDPLKLNETFEDVIKDSILATQVSVKMVLHRGLYFRDQGDDLSCHTSRTAGNVRADTEVTFEFGVRKTRIKEVLYDNKGGTTFFQTEENDPIYDLVGAEHSMINGLEELPFQVQISFTGRDGGQYLRLITMNKPVTRNREFAEQNANVAIVGAHAAQNAAKLAVEGDFGQAQMNALVTQKLVERHAEQRGDGEEIYGAYIASVAPMQHEINKAQKRELLEIGENLSDVEEDDELDPKPSRVPGGGKERAISQKKKQRRKNISDRTASLFYRMKAVTSRNFSAAI
ncbi:circularly permutated Ras protein 1-like isoform X4 [Apostichopus japonicus]|uniref:circularly permutated Ras protein 1-like isoform X4 n=1 Tax=Stichopus japonicus TaxID=307972 RepID=UPI003AB8AA07